MDLINAGHSHREKARGLLSRSISSCVAYRGWATLTPLSPCLWLSTSEVHSLGPRGWALGASASLRSLWDVAGRRGEGPEAGRPEEPAPWRTYVQQCLMWKLTTYSALVLCTEMAKGSKGWKVKATRRRTVWLMGRPSKPAWISNFSRPESRA